MGYKLPGTLVRDIPVEKFVSRFHPRDESRGIPARNKSARKEGNYLYSGAKILVPILLLGYFLIAWAPRFSHFDKEVYPFYHWGVFTKVPQREQSGFEVRILEVEGKRIEPVFLADARGAYTNGTIPRPDYYRRIEVLGRALKRNEGDKILASRRSVEELFLKAGIVYEVLEVTYNPIERLRSGEFIKSERLGVFEAEVVE